MLALHASHAGSSPAGVTFVCKKCHEHTHLRWQMMPLKMGLFMSDCKLVWRKKVRAILAEAFGGKCAICGYDKTIAALDYHHVDSKDKDHLLSKAMKNGYAWYKIIIEARKCALVCCRCHREIHAGVAQLPENYARFNESYSDIVKLPVKQYDGCPVCGTIKNKKQKYCSHECASDSFKKFESSKEELTKLIAEKPYEEIGKMFGVTGNAIKKRCKSLGIKLVNRRGYWQKMRL